MIIHINILNLIDIRKGMFSNVEDFDCVTDTPNAFHMCSGVEQVPNRTRSLISWGITLRGDTILVGKITIGSVATVGAIAVICAAFWIGFTAAHSWAQGISTR